MIETFKTLKGLYNIDQTQCFKYSTYGAPRGHKFKLQLESVSKDVRKNSFSQRVCTEWNNLPSNVVVQSVTKLHFTENIDFHLV